MTSGNVTVQVVQSAFWATNTGIITAPDGSVVLVDPGVYPAELAALAERVGEGRLIAGIATHEDWDHVLWARALGDVPRYAHPEPVRILEERRPQLLARLREVEQELGVTWDYGLVGRLEPATGDVLKIGDAILIRFIPIPGHTAGMTALWLEEPGILFAGDMLSDVDIPFLAPEREAAMRYLDSLETLEALLPAATIVIPGHGSTYDRATAMEWLRRDRAYVEALFAWSQEPDCELPPLDTLLPDDPRTARDENADAHQENGKALRG